jgi:hypothetical protein
MADPSCRIMTGRGQRVLTEDQVSERVVAAFEVDRRLPRVAKPKAPGGSHPTVYRSEALRFEVAQARKLAGIKDDEPVRIHPTQAEIAQAEEAFEWIAAVASIGSRVITSRDAEDGRIIRTRENDQASLDLALALRVWAARQAEPVKTKGKNSIRSIAAGLGMPPMKLLRRKDKALALIVERLGSTLH